MACWADRFTVREHLPSSFSERKVNLEPEITHRSVRVREPGEGRDDSGANWRKRDVGELVQGAVAVEVGSQGPAALVRP